MLMLNQLWIIIGKSTLSLTTHSIVRLYCIETSNSRDGLTDYVSPHVLICWHTLTQQSHTELEQHGHSILWRSDPLCRKMHFIAHKRFKTVGGCGYAPDALRLIMLWRDPLVSWLSWDKPLYRGRRISNYTASTATAFGHSHALALEDVRCPAVLEMYLRQRSLSLTTTSGLTQTAGRRLISPLQWGELTTTSFSH